MTTRSKRLAALVLASHPQLRSLYVTLTGKFRRQPNHAHDIARINDIYRNDEWSNMRSFTDAPRFGAIAEWVRRLAPNGPVLDMGAGDGVLARALRHMGIDYTGVDLSQEVVTRVEAELGDAKTRFETGDAMTYAPTQSFPVIVFNDMLYYLDDPIACVNRYLPYLEPGGSFIVTMFVQPTQIRLIEALHEAFDVTEECHLINSANRVNTMLTLKPKVGAAAGVVRASLSGSAAPSSHEAPRAG
jgi:2-polyprenyl-3-methyl-5-hydroxy-6-metoxy-1,4-benzoquinol methylase